MTADVRSDLGGVLEQARAVVSGAGLLTSAEDMAPYLADWRGRYRGEALCVARPRTVEEAAALVRLFAGAGIAIVPQGGNTGLVGGAIGLPGRPTAIINLGRLAAIREIDPLNGTMTVEAGCVLATAKQAADDVDRLLPIDIGSEGSCQIGGLVSTNAGGTNALRYGTVRQLVLGLEAVLASGEVWSGLRGLRKDNTGYDLKQLFIGAEGTLGLVTAAVLKLSPRPRSAVTAFMALPSVAAALELLALAQARHDGGVTAFEIVSQPLYELILAHAPMLRRPVALRAPWYALVEITSGREASELQAACEQTLALGMERELISDAALAASESQSAALWAIRHSVSEATKRTGFVVSNDTSVPVSRVPDFVAAAEARLAAAFPAAIVGFVGHIGDGNVHAMVVLPHEDAQDQRAREALASQINDIVHRESVALDGSISAEHGIGLMHRDRLSVYKPSLDLALMRAIKLALDPHDVMNPGKVLAPRREPGRG